jgi:hypothetical protein
MIDARAFLNNHVAVMTNVSFICACAFVYACYTGFFSAQAYPLNLFNSNTCFQRDP